MARIKFDLSSDQHWVCRNSLPVNTRCLRGCQRQTPVEGDADIRGPYSSRYMSGGDWDVYTSSSEVDVQRGRRNDMSTLFVFLGDHCSARHDRAGDKDNVLVETRTNTFKDCPVHH